MNKLRLGVLMDPIEHIKVVKDSSFAMLLAAQKRGYTIYYMQQHDLSLRDGRTWAHWQAIKVKDDQNSWFEILDSGCSPLDEFLDVLLMRKDPPFDMEYVYTTHLLELAERRGVLMVNKPQGLRDANEKLYTAWFPQCCTPMLVSRSIKEMSGFVAQHGDVIVKPLDMMGGASIFRVTVGDPNLSVILETVTNMETQLIMAQKFIPEISEHGDKRILLVDGKPAPYALARIPKKGETRGNLAAGGRGEGVELSERDCWICEQVGPSLAEKGFMFVGLDVIGDYLTEINVTSPTCIRELDALYQLDIAGDLMDAIERKSNKLSH